jgi:cytochrome oxidase Cu insertion factor (SCO1/SenC/PrrC family)
MPDLAGHIRRGARVYGIDPGVMQARMPLSRQPGAPPIPDAVGTPARDLTSTLAHTDAIYLIDPQGRERVLLRSDLDPAALARDLSLLTN